jgi:hypothetical protein
VCVDNFDAASSSSHATGPKTVALVSNPLQLASLISTYSRNKSRKRKKKKKKKKKKKQVSRRRLGKEINAVLRADIVRNEEGIWMTEKKEGKKKEASALLLFMGPGEERKEGRGEAS